MSDCRIEFLYNALADCQGTIRAIDVKLNIMLTFLILPLTLLGKIAAKASFVIHRYNHGIYKPAFYLLLLVFCFSWVLSIAIAFMGLRSIRNPSRYIENDVGAKGSFYLGEIFKPKLLNLFMNRSLFAAESVKTAIADLPANEDLIVNELTFEQIKIALIRNIKVFRQNISLFFMMVWIFSGGAIWIISLTSK